jgi:hypothetical protein
VSVGPIDRLSVDLNLHLNLKSIDRGSKCPIIFSSISTAAPTAADDDERRMEDEKEKACCAA